MSGGIELQPLAPLPLILVPALAAALLLGIAALRRARGLGWRVLVMATLVLVLLGPAFTGESRRDRPDVAVVVVDESESQDIGDRRRQTAEALQRVDAALSRFAALETRVVQAPGDDSGTRLFDALERTLAGVPRQRLAGTILITDGQVHDVPAGPPAAVPLHVLLTGRPGERDRRLSIEKAPGYGMVGHTVAIAYRVEDSAAADGPVEVSVRRDGGEPQTVAATLGRTQTLEITLDHAGPTVIELEAEAAEGELSARNNRTAVSINGVRDRLRVLLVSGQPHAGERTWRNLLKSDPSVDLVHFTILRPPEKDDFTPIDELALIVFPTRELFVDKLHEFDLVVLDRYMVRNVLPPPYFGLIADYVRGGGALLLVVGPEFAGVSSLFETRLGPAIPGQPTGKVLEQAFRPRLTPTGRRHPVTAALPGSDGATPWGRWFRHIEAVAERGVVLMEGGRDLPLLVLDRVGQGRVAQLMSDHIWLWARGFEGGGPHAELSRRLAHWLMKEPDLEEENLTAHIDGGRLLIDRRSLSSETPPLTVTAPSGAVSTVVPEAAAAGVARATIEAPQRGLYRVEDGRRRALAVSGSLNPPELGDIRATAGRLAPLAAASGGGVAWIAEGMPELRPTLPGRDTAGRGWMGLRRNQSYEVTGLIRVPLVPAPLFLILVLGGLLAAWWRESR